jgi:hypothetical protein
MDRHTKEVTAQRLLTEALDSRLRGNDEEGEMLGFPPWKGGKCPRTFLTFVIASGAKQSSPLHAGMDRRGATPLTMTRMSDRHPSAGWDRYRHRATALDASLRRHDEKGLGFATGAKENITFSPSHIVSKRA